MTLHFAEVWFKAAGSRRFAVLLEGIKVFEEYDPLAAGFATASTLAFPVEVLDGALEVAFVSKANHPQLSAIEVERLD